MEIAISGAEDIRRYCREKAKKIQEIYSKSITK